MNNLEFWNKVKQPPPQALRAIQAGRLKGKSDINPMWRYQAMTEMFGPCGIGWKFEVVKLWTEPANDGQTFAFAHVLLYVKEEVPGRGSHVWSDPIPGIGGSLLLQKESSGIHANDEAFKMATTDALGTAMKMLGFAADVYGGLWDGTKYRDAAPHPAPASPGAQPAPAPAQRQNSGAPVCPKCKGPMWDNRGKKTNPNAPDFKCKDKANCDGVVWPPKDRPHPADDPQTGGFDPDQVPF